MHGIYLISALLLLQDQPKPLPELKPLLSELRKTLRTDSALLSQYTFTEKRTTIQLDNNNKPKKTEINVFEVFPGAPDRVGYSRQIVKDGKPLSAAELEKKDREMKKKAAEDQRKLDKRTPEQIKKKTDEEDREEQRIMDDVFAGYDAEIVSRESLAGRSVILVHFKPKPGYKAKTSEGKAMQHIAGRAWISEDDYQIARVEMEVVEPISFGLGMLARLKKGATIQAERQKFNEEIWLPVKLDVTVDARVLLLKGFHMRQVVEYSDHKKYRVDTKLSFPDLDKP